VNQQPAEQDSPRYRTQPTISSGDCRLVDDALEEYALGVANPSQCVAIERHMAACTRCAALVDGYRQTVAALALAVPLFTPPANARTALFSRVAITSQSVTPTAPAFSGNLDAFRTATLPSSNAAIVPMPPQAADSNAWWKVYAAPLATLPLLLALGLLGAWGFNNYAKLHDANGVIDSQAAEIADLGDQLDPEDQAFVNFVFAPSVKRYNLTSDTGAQSATLLADPISGQAALQVDGLNAGYYSIFVQTQDGTMMEKAVFKVGPEGTASTAVDLGESVTDFQSVHIRAVNPMTESDMADEAEPTDVLLLVLGPNINQSSGTGIQGT
jgi:hypothetical protein